MKILVTVKQVPDTATQVKIRRLLGDDNADVKNLFTRAGLAYLAPSSGSAAEGATRGQL